MNTIKKNLVKCKDGKWAPQSIICVHLYEGVSDWNRVPVEGCEDWLCDDCMDRFYDLEVDDLRSVCLHCVREMQEESGFKKLEIHL